MNTLKVYQIGALTVAVLIVSSLVLWAWSGGMEDVGVSTIGAIEPGQIGFSTNQVITNGTIVFPEKEILTFGSQEIVKEVWVKQGQPVAMGQVLATLEEQTVAHYHRLADQARFDLQAAMKSRQAATNRYALALLEQQRAVVTARMQLEEAEYAVTELERDQSLKLARAHQERVDAAMVLKEAEANLANYQSHYEQELAQARQSKLVAEIALREAQDNLAYYQSVNDQELAEAQKARSDAESDLRQAQQALASADSEHNLAVVSARRAQADAAAALKIAEKARVAILLNHGSTDEELLLRSNLEVEFRQAVLNQADFDLGMVQSGAEALRRQQLEAAVELARSNRQIATEALTRITGQSNPLLRAKQEADLAVAEADLTQASALLSQIESGHNALDLESRESHLTVARENFVQAGENLARIQEDQTELALDLANSRRAIAQETLAQATQDLRQLQDGPDQIQMMLLNSEVALAESNLRAALEQIKEINVRSPMAGFVSLLEVTVGAAADRDNSIIEITGSNPVEIEAEIDEAQVLYLREGMDATVTLHSLPEQVLSGKISAISMTASIEDGVAVYPTRIRLEIPDGLRLREGLTGAVRIMITDQP